MNETIERNETVATSETYTIPACNFAEFEVRVAKLNRRAKRLGVSPIKYAAVHHHWDIGYHELGSLGNRSGCRPNWCHEDSWEAFSRRTGAVANGERREWLTLTVDGEAPKYAGWQFIATLEPLGEQNIVKAVPGEECPPEYRDRVGECDHCGHKRQRNETFVVRHDSGEHKMVGRSCLKDFLGHTDPHRLARWAEWLAELGELCGEASDPDGDFYGGGYVRPVLEIEHFLRWTSSVIRQCGWVSRGEAKDSWEPKRSTADTVMDALLPPSSHMSAEDRRQHEKWVASVTPDDRATQEAKEAIEWVKSLEADELERSDYLYNIRTVADAGVVIEKHTGLAASIIAAYCRARDREIERRQREERQPSEHVGEVKQRLHMTVTVDRIIPKDGIYGTTYITKMTDDKGNDLVWFASVDKLEEGETYHVKATVKRHDEYNGRPQTIVTRVAVE